MSFACLRCGLFFGVAHGEQREGETIVSYGQLKASIPQLVRLAPSSSFWQRTAAKKELLRVEA